MNTHFSSDNLMGPAAPDLGWVPAPRYVLRRDRILRQLRGFNPCEVLEIGSGAGMLLQELAARGFTCSAMETSSQARALIRTLCSRSGHHIETHDSARSDWENRFPLVMAFEVLEHIEDDSAALNQWSRWLVPGGTLLMSVPAHPWQWNAADVWAGHFRRYRKADLISLVEAAGLQLQHIECTGFPLGNVTEYMQARSIARSVGKTENEGDRQHNNDRSGVDRSHVMRWYPLLQSSLGRAVLRTALVAQALAARVPAGNGYLLRAKKPQ